MIFVATAVEADEPDTSEVIFACDGGGFATIFHDSVRPKLKPDAVQKSVPWRDSVSLKFDEDTRHFSVQSVRPIRLSCGSGDKAVEFLVTAAWDTDLKEAPWQGLRMWPNVIVEWQGQVLLKDVALTMCEAPPPADQRNCAVTIFAYVGSAPTPRIALHRLTMDWIQ
jgi:hypothetical protein